MRSEHENKASFKDVILLDAKIDGQIDMTGTTMTEKLNAYGVHVGQSLLMASDGENKASFNEVVLRGAKIDDQMDLRGASVTGTLDGDGIQVGQYLLMRSEHENNASFKDIIRDAVLATPREFGPGRRRPWNTRPSRCDDFRRNGDGR